jgi:hypothetical protein
MPIRYDNDLARTRAIQRVRSIEKFLDSAFVLPIIRMRAGFDGVLGLLPVVGNVVTTTISLVVVYEAVRLGVKPFTLAKMLGNVGIDLLLGEVPIAGDIADFLFKANKRNLALLTEELRLLEPTGASTTEHAAAGSKPASADTSRATTWTSTEQPRKFVPNLAQ